MEIPQSKTEDCLIQRDDSSSHISNINHHVDDDHSDRSGKDGDRYTILPVSYSFNDQPSSSPKRYQNQMHGGQLGSGDQNLRVDTSAHRRASRLSFIGQSFTKSVIQDPSANYCLRLCCRGWLGILRLLIALRAILARFVFLALTLTLVVTVVRTKEDNVYWLLCLLMLPLLGDLCYSIGLVVAPRKVRDNTEKWFTKCLLAYLLCACPPIWIIELHHLQQLNEATDVVIHNQALVGSGQPVTTNNPWTSAGFVYNEPNENLIVMGESVEDYLNAVAKKKMKISIDLGPTGKPQLRRTRRAADNAVTLQHYPLKMRVRIMEQILLLSVIVGRWLLPRHGISRDQLSQLLLINIGTAADILELFEAFNEEAVRTNNYLNICILCLWQASLLQFCFNKTATRDRPTAAIPRSVSRSSTMNDLHVTSQPNIDLSKVFRRNSNYNVITRVSPRSTDSGCCLASCCRPSNSTSSSAISACGQLWFGTELWAIVMSLVLQDVPFLALRLSLVLNFNVWSYSNIFFTCKNSLLILLQVFRSVVIVTEFRRQNAINNANLDIPMILIP